MVLLMLKAKLQVPVPALVTGRLRHSPSNGGSERFNRTIEEKVPYVAVFGQRMQQPRPLMANQVAQVNLRRRGGRHRGSAALALATRKIGTH
eukprot:jgi/Tetstr1/431037/TSEL_020756.t1